MQIENRPLTMFNILFIKAQYCTVGSNDLYLFDNRAQFTLRYRITDLKDTETK